MVAIGSDASFALSTASLSRIVTLPDRLAEKSSYFRLFIAKGNQDYLNIKIVYNCIITRLQCIWLKYNGLVQKGF